MKKKNLRKALRLYDTLLRDEQKKNKKADELVTFLRGQIADLESDFNTVMNERHEVCKTSDIWERTANDWQERAREWHIKFDEVSAKLNRAERCLAQANETTQMAQNRAHDAEKKFTDSDGELKRLQALFDHEMNKASKQMRFYDDLVANANNRATELARKLDDAVNCSKAAQEHIKQLIKQRHEMADNFILAHNIIERAREVKSSRGGSWKIACIVAHRQLDQSLGLKEAKDKTEMLLSFDGTDTPTINVGY
jgi:chromosome segregation ATPase